MHRLYAVSCGWRAASAAFAVIAVALLASAINAGPASAQGNACVASCKASHNQCRIATKGNASCDAQLQSCLQACLRK
jgi:anti-sigma-K factor RskA